jgi:hypothetical protein
MSKESIMITTTPVQVFIPGPSASRSKVQKKGYKCWCKKLTSVKSPARTGYDYEGEFLGVEKTVELNVGDVILHIDESGSNGIGIIVPVPDNSDYRPIVWVTSTSGSWAGALAGVARDYLAMSPEDRVKRAVEKRVSNPNISEDVRAFYMDLLNQSPAPGDNTNKEKDQAIQQIRELMAKYQITFDDI